MYTTGFVPSSSDAVTIGTPFRASVGGISTLMTSCYLTVGGAGDIVWRNAYGDLNWLPGAVAGQTYIIGAAAIVATGTVNGVSRTTTATNMTWYATNNPN